MEVAPFDIYFVKVEWGECIDKRPAVVTRVHADGRFICGLISSQLDLFVEGRDFLVSDSDRDFAATGLARTSFVSGEGGYTLEPQRTIRRLGEMTSGLRRGFSSWWLLRTGFPPG